MRKASGAIIAATMLLLCGCQKKEAVAAPTINNSMTKIMQPNAEVIWDLMSSAYNDKGDALVADKISEAGWKSLADATQKMKDRAQILADAEHLVVADANEPIMGSDAAAKGVKGEAGPDWDAVSAQQVQAKIDGNRKLFSEKARILVDAADKMNRAAATKDAALLYRVGSELDEVCDGCHEPFWGTDEPPPFPKQ
ncbi:MAG: cytochrome c [Sphingobium sp.]|nr:cytochrome c [Sphingobium sp.]